MAETSCIHLEPIMGHSELHNGRFMVLDYVRVDKTIHNEIWIGQSVADATAEAKKLCKELTGRSMQEKAVPVKEAIVVLNEKHNIEDLKNLGRVIQDRFGIKCIQTYIHRDEGHYDLENTWKPNLHAHMVFNFTNQTTGKSIKLNRQDLRELQTLVAENMGMKRGMSSDKRHLNSLQYAIKAKTEDVKNLNESIKKITNDLSNFQDIEKSVKDLKNKAIFGMHTQSSIDMLESALKLKETALQEKERVIKELELKISNLPNISKLEYEKQNKSLTASLKYFEKNDLKIIEPRKFQINGNYEVVEKNFEHKTINELKQEKQIQSLGDLAKSKEQNRGYKI